MLKAIALENAVSKLKGVVVGLQTAINQGASVEEVSKHYSSVVFEVQVIQSMLADVRKGCFNSAVSYHYSYDV